MRVLIDTSYRLRAPVSGTAVYLDRVCEALAARGDVELVQVADKRRRPPAGGGLGSARNAAADLWWTAVELPRLARGVDVIHHPLPAISPGTGIPQVVTVHDLAFERLPDAFDRRFRTYARFAHRSAARRADAVICVSDTTAADVRELWGVSGSRIVVARHGPGQRLPAAARGGAPEHFLYVGDAEPRKNLGTLLAAYARYREAVEEPLGLVLAGPLPAGAGGPSTDPGVRVERSAPAGRLASLYAGAAALVHPSLYEGFGLTVLEAMGAGVPVIAADAPGVRELCGDAALFADPRDPVSFAGSMSSLASDTGRRRRMSAAGRARAGGFSWAASARAHVDAYSLASEPHTAERLFKRRG